MHDNLYIITLLMPFRLMSMSLLVSLSIIV